MSGSLIIIDKARAQPLTDFKPPRPDAPGTFDGGVYFPDGRPCLLGASRMINHQNQPGPVRPSVVRVEGTHLWGGMLNNIHFGHFISESLSRLWALDIVQKPASVVFFTRLPQQPLPRWAVDIVGRLAPGLAITHLRQPSEFDRIVVPDAACLPSGVMRGDGLNRRFLHDRLVPTPSRIDAIWGQGPRKLYVSRSNLQSEAQILFEDRIEASMKAQGYRVIYPETLSIEDQLALYRGADNLVFSEGSALHVYALVCRPDQRVFVIWRRRETYGGFAHQIESFGGPVVQGVTHVRSVLVPKEAPQALARAHGIVDFPSLSRELADHGFIDRADWLNPEAGDYASLIRSRYSAFSQN